MPSEQILIEGLMGKARISGVFIDDQERSSLQTVAHSRRILSLYALWNGLDAPVCHQIRDAFAVRD